MEFEINTGKLNLDVSSVRAELQAMRRAVADLRQTASALNRMWEGEAKNDFLSRYARDIAALEEAIAALERFTVLTEESVREYERCEGAVEDIVSSIRI